MTASGCVWSTCGAGTKACSSVSIEGRGWSGRGRCGAGGRPSRRRPSASRSRSGSSSSSRGRRSPPRVIVARSVPEPLTQSTRVSRPAWSSERLLRGRVAAADVGERAVGAEQVRAVDEAVEHVEPCRRGVVPAVGRGLDPRRTTRCRSRHSLAARDAPAQVAGRGPAAVDRVAGPAQMTSTPRSRQAATASCRRLLVGDDRRRPRGSRRTRAARCGATSSCRRCRRRARRRLPSPA